MTVRKQVLLGHKYIHQHLSHQLGRIVIGIIFNNNVLKFSYTLFKRSMVILMLAYHYIKRLTANLTFQQVLHKGMDMRILVFHVPSHLRGVFVIEFQNKHRNLVRRRAVNSLQQLTADIRQAEIHKITV